MTPTKVVAALSVFALLLLAPPAVSQVPDDKLIVPGQRIGKWTLEMTIADLERIYGPARRNLFRAGEAPVADAARDFTLVFWKVGVGAWTVDQKTVVVLGVEGDFAGVATLQDG